MRHRAFDLMLLLGAWLAVCAIVRIAGDFPLNDDWSYAIAVQRLLQDGVFHPTAWTSMPLLTHALWGALFCLPNGFSHEALRLSTVVLGGLGILSTYGLLIEVGATRVMCLAGAAVVGLNPLWVSLSFTFMTDVPFTTFSTLALLLFARSLRTHSQTMAVFGTVLMSLAVLNRQLGLFVGAAYAAGLVRRDGCSVRTVLRALVPLGIGGVLLLCLQTWLQMRDALPAEYSVKSRALLQALTDPGELTHSLLHGAFIVLTYLGLFLLPLILLTPQRHSTPTLTWIARATTIGLAALLLLTGKMMPFGMNAITPAGIGPDALRDVYILGMPNRAPLPQAFWMLLTGLAALGAGPLVTRILAAASHAIRGSSNAAPIQMALLIGSLAYLTPLLTQGLFDRYLLVLLPVLAALLSIREPTAAPAEPSAMRATCALAAMLPLALLAVIGTHDWLARSRARWQAIHWLQDEQGVDAMHLDAGFEFHGMHTYDPSAIADPLHSWWWVHDDEYVVAMGPLPGYRCLRSFPVDRWLPPRDERITVLQRDLNPSAPR